MRHCQRLALGWIILLCPLFLTCGPKEEILSQASTEPLKESSHATGYHENALKRLQTSHGDFDPLDRLLPLLLPVPEDAVRDNLQTMVQQKIFPESIYIVQARHRAESSYARCLQAQGAQILGFLPPQAYVIGIASETIAQLEKNEWIRSILPLEPLLKVPPALLVHRFSQPSLEMFSGRKYFWLETSQLLNRSQQQWLKESLARFGGAIVDHHEHFWLLSLSFTSLRYILELPVTLWVETVFLTEDEHLRQQLLLGKKNLAISDNSKALRNTTSPLLGDWLLQVGLIAKQQSHSLLALESLPQRCLPAATYSLSAKMADRYLKKQPSFLTFMTFVDEMLPACGVLAAKQIVKMHASSQDHRSISSVKSFSYFSDLLEEMSIGHQESNRTISFANQSAWQQASLFAQATPLPALSTHVLTKVSDGLDSDEKLDTSFYLKEEGPVKIILTWTDEEALPLASYPLVNDLEVVLFYGSNIYHGRSWLLAANETFSLFEPLEDSARRYSHQIIYLPALPRGVYGVQIRAHQIPFAKQPFVLFVVGDVQDHRY